MRYAAGYHNTELWPRLSSALYGVGKHNRLIEGMAKGHNMNLAELGTVAIRHWLCCYGQTGPAAA